MVIDIDDEVVVNLSRLFNEPAGHEWLSAQGVPDRTLSNLPLLGFSGIANLSMAIKFSKYYELGPDDVVLTVLTDSMDLYQSRLVEMHEEVGSFQLVDASAAHARYLMGLTTDHLLELSYEDRRRIHNLKYFTWVEQQGKTHDEIVAQWYDDDYWTGLQSQIADIDDLINEFNERVGLM